jgi:hypothetical protein
VTSGNIYTDNPEPEYLVQRLSLYMGVGFKNRSAGSKFILLRYSLFYIEIYRNNKDHDGDAISAFAVLTDEAQEQAKREMNPRHTKSAWQPGSNAGRLSYEFTLDASAAMYAATKV